MAAGFSSLLARVQGGAGVGASVAFLSPFKRVFGGAGSITAGATVTIDVSDTASLSGTEEPVDSQEIQSSDTARLSVSESRTLFNNLGLSDTAAISLSESINLTVVGVTLKTASDTASITLSGETSVLDVTLDVTDTASITLSAETPTVDVLAEQIIVSDTASLSAEDESLLNIFAGFNDINVTDTATLTLGGEVATVVEVGRIRRAKAEISFWRAEGKIL